MGLVGLVDLVWGGFPPISLAVLARLVADTDGTELALLGSPTGLLQALLLLGRLGLLRRDNVAPLIHLELRTHKATRGLVGSAMPNLRTATLEQFILLAVYVVHAIFVLMDALHLNESGSNWVLYTIQERKKSTTSESCCAGIEALR